MATLTGAEEELLERAEDIGLMYLASDDFDEADLKTRRIPMSSRTSGEAAHEVGNFQISYNFSYGVRNNLFPVRNAVSKPIEAYGEAGFSYRLLYEYLCNAYNGGEYFVDTYFESVFDTRPVYLDFLEINDTIMENIEEERASLYAELPMKADGTPDRRRKQYKKFQDFSVWQDPVIKRSRKDIANAIKDDIVRCLSTGEIPLSGKSTVADTTMQKRSRLIGIEGNRLFYASGQLIEHLNIFVEV